MNKLALRNYYKEKRAQLEPEERLAASSKIALKLDSAFSFENELISVFLPISRLFEIDTRFIIEKLSSMNTFCSPVADFSDHTMKHIQLSGDTILEENEWGIPEPSYGHIFKAEEISVVLVPLLISDIHGNRLGYGKGFYDRFLANTNKDVVVVGLNYFEPIEALPELNEHDIPLHYLITPENVHKSK